MSDQDQFLNVIDRDEAERRFHAVIQLTPLGIETIPLSEAMGRVLAGDVISAVDVPSFDRSNYDGFAVRAEDTHGADEETPRTLALSSESITTAVVPKEEVRPGRAAAIATGGMLPRGADSVVMVEDTDVVENRLVVRRAVTAGFGVACAGTDVSTGEIILRRGERLTSRETGVLAAVGEQTADVWRRPVVGVVSTGNEIIEPGQPMRPGLVFDSNARIISDAVAEAGGIPRTLGIIQDDLLRLRVTITEALDSCDLVVLSGGTSKGEGDISYRVVREHCDPGVVAHGVALKPGKPICLAAHHGKPVVVLPGFPTSAIFTFHEFVAPVIRRLAGSGRQATMTTKARLAVKVNSIVGRTEYLLVGLVPQPKESQPRAYPMGKGSGSVTTFSRADGFATIPRQDEIVEAGTEVSVQLLGKGLQPADLVAIGSHCVGLDHLLGLLHDRGFHTKLINVGSMGGLAAAKRGECDVAGIHLLDPKTGQYNQPFLNDDLCRIAGYTRKQGILHRKGDARFAGKPAEHAVQAAVDDSHCMMVNRNKGSGTRILIDRMLAGAQPPGYGIQSQNHHAVAAAVLQGRADWGIAIQYVAREAALEFIPIEDEHYDFVVPRDRIERPAVVALRELLEDTTVRDELARLGFGS